MGSRKGKELSGIGGVAYFLIVQGTSSLELEKEGTALMLLKRRLI